MTILLIDAGGTISSTEGADGRLVGSVEGLDSSGLARRQIYAGLSEEMSLADMARVRDAVVKALGEPDVSGIIVAHGTDALEETAFLTDLALGIPAKPVIFTGAMLPMDAQGSDAPRNLADAIRAAATPELARHGALVCFAGYLIPAAAVYKHATTALDGFRWRLGGAGRIGSFVAQPPPLPRFAALPPVLPVDACPVIVLSGGDDGWTIDAAVDHGARGLVLMALGRGNASARACAAAERAVARGVPVVVASRCPTGATAGDYATGQALADAGAVFSGDLGPTQARILLSYLVALSLPMATIHAEFARRGQLTDQQ